MLCVSLMEWVKYLEMPVLECILLSLIAITMIILIPNQSQEAIWLLIGI